MSLAWMGLTELKSMLDAGQLSSLELTEFLLHRIDKADSTLHAFTEVYAEQARALARGADQQRAGFRIKNGDEGFGIGHAQAGGEAGDQATHPAGDETGSLLCRNGAQTHAITSGNRRRHSG